MQDVFFQTVFALCGEQDPSQTTQGQQRPGAGPGPGAGAARLLRFSLSHLLMNLLVRLHLMRKCICTFIVALTGQDSFEGKN